MCTMIMQKAQVSGSGKGQRGWFTLREANVSYDHPFHAPLDHALNIDFVNEAEGVDARVAVELTPEAARQLVRAINAALEEGAKVDPKGVLAPHPDLPPGKGEGSPASVAEL